MQVVSDQRNTLPFCDAQFAADSFHVGTGIGVMKKVGNQPVAAPKARDMCESSSGKPDCRFEMESRPWRVKRAVVKGDLHFLSLLCESANALRYTGYLIC